MSTYIKPKNYNNAFIEQSYWSINNYLIAGLDEAGRGCLAGPVVAACVIMSPNNILTGIDDSKKLSSKRRNIIYNKILDNAIDLNIGIIGERDIDSFNILNASKMAFLKALKGLKKKPDIIFTDAIKIEVKNNISLIKGDSRMYTIAAASIIAKVFRDRLMYAYDKLFPLYDFKTHKGYGTKNHFNLIKKYGPSPLHRRTFLNKILNE